MPLLQLIQRRMMRMKTMTKVKMCPKINDCYKIKMILDKDMCDFQYATCIREVCEICRERKDDK
jgi:hypothetical protein